MSAMTEPSPAQFDAMREWLADRARAEQAYVLAGAYERATPDQLLGHIAAYYKPGGVERFLADHKEQGS